MNLTRFGPERGMRVEIGRAAIRCHCRAGWCRLCDNELTSRSVVIVIATAIISRHLRRRAVSQRDVAKIFAPDIGQSDSEVTSSENNISGLQ